MLTELIRPETINDLIGQSHIKKLEHPVMKMINHKIPKSLILYGPPGTGKTSLAKILAKASAVPYEEMNATVHSTGDIKKVIDSHKEPFILILDEIHYLNKRFQSILLSYIENGIVICIGTTTENPYRAISDAIRSRMFLVPLYAPKESEIRPVLEKVKAEFSHVKIDLEAEKRILSSYDKDIRKFVTGLDLLFSTSTDEITILEVESVMGGGRGEDTSKLMSAFIKSLRGSDENAAVYYLSRMVQAGMPGQQIFRRLSLFVVEDIGLAKPEVIRDVASAQQLYNNVGDEERDSILILIHITIYLALVPKSRSVVSTVNSVFKELEGKRLPNVPPYLLNSYKGKIKIGMEGVHYLPNECKNQVFYEPTESGHEAKVKEYLRKKRSHQDKVRLAHDKY
ncbi:AAA family ATPase [Priestia koreensis]|uniref:AAA family ATPase n=1 Tax=Priestia koreensis TaxID=284581 RepID=UPI003D01AAE2